MEEFVKFSLSGVFSGATVLALFSFAGKFIKQKREIQDPLRVAPVRDYVTREEFTSSLAKIEERVEKTNTEIFTRLGAVERSQARTEGVIVQVNDRLKSNDDKLTVILQQIRKGTKQ